MTVRAGSIKEELAQKAEISKGETKSKHFGRCIKRIKEDFERDLQV